MYHSLGGICYNTKHKRPKRGSLCSVLSHEISSKPMNENDQNTQIIEWFFQSCQVQA
jgi:hypothetical protein